MGTAKAQILQAIEAGSVAGIEHFALFVDNRDARKFMREKTNDGKLSSVTSIEGVNFQTSRHDGWPDKPQIFVKVSGLKKHFPEPLFTKPPGAPDWCEGDCERCRLDQRKRCGVVPLSDADIRAQTDSLEADAESRASKRAICAREFAKPGWSVWGVISWIAYRDSTRFTAIADNRGLTAFKFYGGCSVIDTRPSRTLEAALQSGALIALRSGVDVPREFWFDRDPLALSGTFFRREDVLALWPPIASTFSFAEIATEVARLNSKVTEAEALAKLERAFWDSEFDRAGVSQVTLDGQSRDRVYLRDAKTLSDYAEHYLPAFRLPLAVIRAWSERWEYRLPAGMTTDIAQLAEAIGVAEVPTSANDAPLPAHTPPTRPATKAEVDQEYVAYVRAFRADRKGLRPTWEEDWAWGRQKNLNHARVKELRKLSATGAEPKGGAPRKKPVQELDEK